MLKCRTCNKCFSEKMLFKHLREKHGAKRAGWNQNPPDGVDISQVFSKTSLDPINFVLSSQNIFEILWRLIFIEIRAISKFLGGEPIPILDIINVTSNADFASQTSKYLIEVQRYEGSIPLKSDLGDWILEIMRIMRFPSIHSNLNEVTVVDVTGDAVNLGIICAYMRYFMLIPRDAYWHPLRDSFLSYDSSYGASSFDFSK